MATVLRMVLAFVAAVAVTTALGSIAQTQFNLAEIAALGAPIPWDVRLRITWHDLLGFSPSYGPIVAAGLLIAFVAAALVLRWQPGWRGWLYPLGGAVAVLTAIWIMNWLFQITPVAATRSVLGLACLVAGGAIGGAVFAAVAPAGTTPARTTPA